MFHINNRVYIGYDFDLTHKYRYILASPLLSNLKMQSTNAEDNYIYSNFEEMLKEKFEGNIENFWEYCLKQTDKLIIFVDKDTMLRLQIQYWMSILANHPTYHTLHFLHNCHVESIRLIAYAQHINAWDPLINQWKKNTILNRLEFVPNNTMWDEVQKIQPSETLRKLDISTISIEYLLLDYFSTGNSPYADILFDRIQLISWDNWLTELESLRYEILTASCDVNKLDSGIDPIIGSMEEKLKRSRLLSWVVDPNFNRDIAYIRKKYDYKIFSEIWDKIDALGHDNHDTLGPINEMLNNDQYDKLLQFDVDQNYGCSFTSRNFIRKSNHVLANWCYTRVREGKKHELDAFKLKV